MPTKPLSASIPRLAAICLIVLFSGCAASGPTVGDPRHVKGAVAESPDNPGNKNLLTRTGFKKVRAITPEQQNYMNALTEGKVTVLRQDGETYYLYPDPLNNQIYVGSAGAYEKLKRKSANLSLWIDGEYLRQSSAGSWNRHWAAL